VSRSGIDSYLLSFSAIDFYAPYFLVRSCTAGGMGTTNCSITFISRNIQTVFVSNVLVLRP